MCQSFVFLWLESHFTEDFSVSSLGFLQGFTHFWDFTQASEDSVVLRFLTDESLDSSELSQVGDSTGFFYRESFSVSQTSVFWNVKHPSDYFVVPMRTSKG